MKFILSQQDRSKTYELKRLKEDFDNWMFQLSKPGESDIFQLLKVPI